MLVVYMLNVGCKNTHQGPKKKKLDAAVETQLQGLRSQQLPHLA